MTRYQHQGLQNKRWTLCSSIVLLLLVASAIVWRIRDSKTSRQITIAFVTNNTADFWSLARRGCDDAAKISNIHVDFRMPGDGTAAEQRRIIDDLIAKGDTAIAISPVDPANQVEMLNQVASRVPLITDDSDAESSQRLCYLGTDNVAAGRQAGELMKQALPSGGDVMIFVGKMDVQNAKERLRGFKESIADTGLKIIDVRTDNADIVRAKANAADALVKYPEIAGMVGFWGHNGPAMLSAVREAHKVGKVKIVAFDEEEATLNGVRSGEIYATVVQQPYEFGYQAVISLEKSIHGDSSWIPESRHIYIPTLAITRDKVDAFQVGIRKIKDIR